MYRIIHPMNNNVALAKHKNGEEVVLIGSGIAFNKKTTLHGHHQTAVNEAHQPPFFR